VDSERGKDPVQVVLDFYDAVWNRRIEEMLALLDPEIACYPLIRPGQNTYYGHDDMVKLVDDLHHLLGNFQFKIDKITEHKLPQGDIRVTVVSRTLPEPGRGQPAVQHLISEYTLHDGLITWIHSKPGSLAGQRRTDAERMDEGRPPASA
jgi:SnoaL-like domain